MLKKILFFLFLIVGVLLAYFFWYKSPNPSIQQTNSIPIQSIHPDLNLVSQTDSVPSAFKHNLKHAIAIGKEYHLSRDLHSFYLKYKDSSNPDEQYLAWQALNFCSWFISSTLDDALTLSPKDVSKPSPERNTANQELYAACSTFNHQFKTAAQFLTENVKNQKNAISSASYSSSLEHVNALEATGKFDEANQYLKEIILSKEPEAIQSIAEIIPLRWKSGDDDKVYTMNVKAIQLATCDLGQECSKDSNNVKFSCVISGYPCDFSRQDQLLSIYNNEEKKKIMEKKAFFLNAIQQGDLASLGLEGTENK